MVPENVIRDPQDKIDSLVNLFDAMADINGTLKILIETCFSMEREECAKIAEVSGIPGHTVSQATAQSIAKKIREKP